MSNDRNVEALARVDPFSIHEMKQAMLKTRPSSKKLLGVNL